MSVTEVAVFVFTEHELCIMILEGKYAASGVVLRQGILVDLTEKKYKLTRRLFGIFNLIDAWKPLPKADYLLMFKTFYATCEACDMSEPATGINQLSIVYNKNRRLLIHESESGEEVLLMATQLAESFRLKIRDAMSNRRSPKWIT